jgi:hypothetical protein
MFKTTQIFAVGAALGLAACNPGAPPEPMYPLVDATGMTVAMVRESVVRNTPPGTALRANINGQDQLVTLGPRVGGGATAGQVRVVGSDEGRPIVERVGPASGSLAPSGTPVTTGVGADGRPIVTYVQPGQQLPAGVAAGARGSRRMAPTATGTLAPAFPQWSSRLASQTLALRWTVPAALFGRWATPRLARHHRHGWSHIDAAASGRDPCGSSGHLTA